MIVGQRRRSAVIVPAGGEIMFYGSYGNIPPGFEFVAAAVGKFVRGVDAGQASDTSVSGNHSHDIPSTGSVANHTHSSNSGTSSAPNKAGLHQESNTQVATKGHTHSVGSRTSSSAGGHSHTMGSTGSVTNAPPYRKLFWIRALENMPVPILGVVMWNGAITTDALPRGFKVCNGTAHALDMRSRFVYGGGSGDTPGAAGGSSSHTHTTPSTGSAGGHNHSVSSVSFSGGATQNTGHVPSTEYRSNKAHTHTGSGTFSSDSNHSHSVGDTNAQTVLPSYIKLFYIIRTE